MTLCHVLPKNDDESNMHAQELQGDLQHMMVICAMSSHMSSHMWSEPDG